MFEKDEMIDKATFDSLLPKEGELYRDKHAAGCLCAVCTGLMHSPIMMVTKVELWNRAAWTEGDIEWRIASNSDFDVHYLAGEVLKKETLNLEYFLAYWKKAL